MKNDNNQIYRFDHDITEKFYSHAKVSKYISWDIETSGLGWQKEKIATCQLCINSKAVAIVRIDNKKPKNLISLLCNENITKIFHHALFDLRFMAYRWDTNPRNISCTKIAAKLLNRDTKFKCSLRNLLKKYLSVNIDKSCGLSDWFSDILTEEQINYVVNDVLYLHPLLEVLELKLQKKGLLELEKKCFEHIPTRVQLDILRYEDVFVY